MSQDNNRKGGQDVKNLFGALGINSGNYQSSAKDKDDEKAGQEAEARWPLLGELRESYNQSSQVDKKQLTADEAAAGASQDANKSVVGEPAKAKQKVKKKAKAAAKPRVETTAESAGKPATKRKPARKPSAKTQVKKTKPAADSAAKDPSEAVAQQPAAEHKAKATARTKRKTVRQHKPKPQVAPARPAQAAPPPAAPETPVDVSLAQVFGLKDGRQQDDNTKLDTNQPAPAREDATLITKQADSPQSPPDQAAPEAEQNNLQSLFARLRTEPAPKKPEPEPEPAAADKPKGIAGMFERLRRKK